MPAASSAAAPPPPPVTAKPTPTPTPSPTPAPATTEAEGEGKEGEKKAYTGPRRRPHITLEQPREWCRPLAKGVEPAYDLALQYVLRDAAALRGELKELRRALGKEEAKAEGERDEARVE